MQENFLQLRVVMRHWNDFPRDVHAQSASAPPEVLKVWLNGALRNTGGVVRLDGL